MIKKDKLTKDKLTDALNLLDEIAEIGAVGFKDCMAQAEAYSLLYDYINSDIQEITIDFTTGDCEEMMRGEEFNWNYNDQYGKEIRVKIYNPDSEEVDEEEDDRG